MANEDSEIFRAFGFAEESERGVAEAAPEMWCDVMNGDLGLPKDPHIMYEGGMGKGNRTHRPGFYNTSPSFEMGFDLKILSRLSHFTLGNRILENTEGDGSPTGEPDTAKEYLYSSNKILLPSFTIFVVSDVRSYVIPGCIMNKLEVSADKDFLTLKADMEGMNETPYAKDHFTVTLNDDYPLAFYEMDVHMRDLGSVTAWGSTTLISEDVKKLSMKVDNGVKAEDGRHLGSRFPKNIPSNSRSPELSFDYDYLTNKYYDLMQGGVDTGPTDDQDATEFEIMIALDGGDYGSAQWFLPRNIVSGAPVDFKGRDMTDQSVTITPFMESVTIPATTPVTVDTDMLMSFIHNFTDSTAGFDGPAVFEDT